jgi:AcrR family transcriptional regulator
LKKRIVRKKKNAYHHEDLSRALVDAALVRIAADGPEALTLRDVARMIGVAHTAVYRHYEDKEALLAAVAEQGFVDLRTQLVVASRAHAEPFERLRALAVAYVRFAQKNPAHFRVMFGPRLSADEHPSLESAFREAVAVIFEIVDDGIARGVIRPLGRFDLTVALVSIAYGYTDQILRGRIKLSGAAAEQYFLQTLTPLLDGMRA